jgi:hypothetical protein
MNNLAHDHRALGSGVALGKPTDMPTVSPFTRLQTQTSRIRDAAGAVEMLADKLCGAVPQPIDDGKGQAGYAGLFDGIDDAASDLDAMASKIERALLRIQNRLP